MRGRGSSGFAARTRRKRPENLGMHKEAKLEITDLRLTIQALFYQTADFMDLLERSRLPVQIAGFTAVSKDGKLDSELTLRIYKKVLED